MNLAAELEQLLAQLNESEYDAEQEVEAELEQLLAPLERVMPGALHESRARSGRRTSIYVTIKGSKQGNFKGEGTTAKTAQKIPVTGYFYKVTSPRDVATGQASGKRQHGAVEFVKQIGAASPQVFQALVTNELLPSVQFEFNLTNFAGEEQVYYTVKLTNATVSQFEQQAGSWSSWSQTATQALQSDAFLERVALTFQKIEIENKQAKTIAMDDWTREFEG